MVGNLPNSESTGGRERGGQNIRLLSRDHNISVATIRSLIQGSLAPLPVDPIPTRVVIDNIRITLDDRGEIAICCDVFYGVEEDWN